jgi:hypothetical protein
MPVTARPTYAVVPSLGRECLADCLASLLPQVDVLFLVKTADFTMPDVDPAYAARLSFIDDLVQPKSISRWWNEGITASTAYALAFGQGQFNVLVVNDDVVACPQLVSALDAGLRQPSPFVPTTARPVLAYPDNYPPYSRGDFHGAAGQVQLSTRISGWCFMLRGEAGLTADERMLWFYSDDHLDWQAREMGGAVMVPNCPVQHLHPNELTAASPELTAQTHRDREMFRSIWGILPH